MEEQQDPASGDAAGSSSARGLPLTRAAVDYACRAHDGRRRQSDRAPYVLHPLEVAALLHLAGAADPVIAAGVLHDVVEHEGTPLGDIERRFGRAVSALVGAVTENPAIEPDTARKAALRAQVAAAGADAGAIFAADKLSKVRELRAAISRAAGASPAKLAHYAASLAMLDRLIPEHPLVEQLRFVLEALPAPAPA